MLLWKQRLYAFLLKRILGPILDDESLEKLHRSIDVSLQEGRFALNDVGLNADYLSSKMKHIRMARLRRIEILLALVEHDDEVTLLKKPSSLAWRAMQLGSASKTSRRVSLVATIEIDGAFVELSPAVSTFETPYISPPDGANTVKTTLASYVEAALSSLRLSVKLNNLRVRISSQTEDCPSKSQKWVEARVTSASYSDEESTGGSGPTPYDTVFHKVLHLQKIMLLTGDTTGVGKDAVDMSSTTIALLDGSARLVVRAVQYLSSPRQLDGLSPTIQHDVEVHLSHRLNLSVDVHCLLTVQSIANEFRRSREAGTIPNVSNTVSDATGIQQAHLTSEEENDLRAIESILKQYQEARLLAEQNVYRGGIILPSEEFDEDGGVTYDAFFDANDQSFARYSIIIQESISLKAPDTESFVHTEVRLHVAEGGIKLLFDRCDRQLSGRMDEYLLLTFSDLKCSACLSIKSKEVSMSVGQLDVEDSQCESSGLDEGRDMLVIGTVLKFSPGPIDTHACSSDEIVAPACTTLSISAIELRGTTLELSLEPVELTYSRRTASNLVDFIRKFQHGRDGDHHLKPPSQKAVSEKQLSFCVSCSTAEVTVPCQVERDFSPLFRRCGYLGSSWREKSSIGISCCGILVERSQSESAPNGSFSCDSIVVFATSPRPGAAFVGRHDRFDVLCLAGRLEVDPKIPITVELWSLCPSAPGYSSRKSHAVSAFPTVPAISTFKARQEDEDDDEGGTFDDPSCFEMLPLGDLRGEVRGHDPQPEMMQNLHAAESAADIHVPEFYLDLSTEEIITLSNMLSLSLGVVVGVEVWEQADRPVGSTTLSVAAACEFVSINVHDEYAVKLLAAEPEGFSFFLQLDSVRTHFLTHGSQLGQLRLLAEELSLYEVQGLTWPTESLVESVHRDRIQKFRRRASAQKYTKASVLAHRSHLFPPISRSSPIVLVDFMHFQNEFNSSHKNVYFTLYDLTFRFDFESVFHKRLTAMLDRLTRHLKPDGMDRDQETVPTMTRLFFTIADCNLDYSSPAKFKIPSRMILRVGDVGFSSNLVSPRPAKQGFQISLADTAVYLCKARIPYTFENSRIAHSGMVFELQQSTGKESNLADVQRQMGMLTVLMLESLQGTVILASVQSSEPLEPRVLVNLTIGELGLYVCKDSFGSLVKSLNELINEATALDSKALDDLRSKNYIDLMQDDSESSDADKDSDHAMFHALEDLKRRSALRPTAGTTQLSRSLDDFLLDGYDWTAIEQNDSPTIEIPPGDEQAARWYGQDDLDDEKEKVEVAYLPTFAVSDQHNGPRLIVHHFPIQPIADPIHGMDLDAAKYAGTVTAPPVRTRVLVHDFKFKLRLFDGFDWPDLLDTQRRQFRGKGAFIIDAELDGLHEEEMLEATKDLASKLRAAQVVELDGKAKLMGELLDNKTDPSPTFQSAPLAEERGAQLRTQADLRRLGRGAGKYFQFAASGVCFRFDSQEDSSLHRLASVLNLKVQDFFVAETISSDRPVKLIGEWVNDAEHPRYSNDGLLMMKMVTWHPVTRVTPNNDILNDEAEAVVKILPLRCILDQKALRFARAFFRSRQDSSKDASLPAGLYTVPPPLFTSFKVKPLKLKVDYRPEKIDTKALRDGAFVELINLSPIDGMVLTLKAVYAENVVGFSEVMIIAVRAWVEDICATQIFKFLANARPFEPITNVGSAATDLVVLPWEAVRNGESIRRALGAGARSLSSAVVYETFTMTSRAAQFLGDRVARMSLTEANNDLLPSRPLDTPRDLLDTTPHVVESLSRGLKAANYKVVIVPYREYRRTGARGAASSVLKGIPVAIAAPTSATAEALSFALLGVRNQMRPDIRQEEEAIQRGLHLDG